MQCGHFKFCSPPEGCFSPPPVFLSSPCPLSRGGHAKTQVTRGPATGHPRRVHAAAAGSCGQQAPQQPEAPLWVSGGAAGLQARRPGSIWSDRAAGGAGEGIQAPRAPYLQCRIAPAAAHLDSILEHPFFSATAASAVTSPGGGPHAATWRLPGEAGRCARGGGKTLEVPGGEGWWPETLALAAPQAVSLDVCSLPDLSRRIMKNNTQEEKSKLSQAPSV